MTAAGRIPRNPYIAGDPVGKTPVFVGREDVLRAVLLVLRHPHENAITLYGQRRIGKTSVLQWLEAHLPEHGPYRPVYFDLMGYAGRPLGEILRALAAAIARHLGLPRPALADPAEEGFRTWLDQVLEQTLPADQSLVLLMDEFDVQADPQADKAVKQHFFAYMRALRRLAPQRLQFVFVLGQTIDDLDIVARGLFKDLPSKRVSLFTREEAERVVRLSEREGSLTWTDAAVARVWDWAGGHPYLTQALCSAVWERAYQAADEEGLETPPPVTPREVDAAVPATLERSENVFAWIWDGLGPAERIVAAALAAAGPGVVDEETLTRILNEAGVGIVIRELRDAPKLLQDWDILAPADGGYRFRVELLRRWIAERKPLRRVQDELDRLVPLAESLYRAALGFFQNGQLDQARNLLQQALGVNPNHLAAHELLAEVSLTQGDLDAAQQILKKLHELAPERARARLKQVYLRRAEAEEDPAARLVWYEKVLDLYPEDPQAREGLFAAWREQGEQALAADDLGAALLAFQRALEIREDPTLHEKVAAIEHALREREIEEALVEIRALEARKDYAAAYEKMQAQTEQASPIIPTKKFREIFHGLWEQGGNFWIVGLPQTGKSTLLRYLKEQLNKKGKEVWVTHIDIESLASFDNWEKTDWFLQGQKFPRRFLLIEEVERGLEVGETELKKIFSDLKKICLSGWQVVLCSYKRLNEMPKDTGADDIFTEKILRPWEEEEMVTYLKGVPKAIKLYIQKSSGGFPVLVREALMYWREVQEELQDEDENVQIDIFCEGVNIKLSVVLQKIISSKIWRGLSEEQRFALWCLTVRQEFEGHLPKSIAREGAKLLFRMADIEAVKHNLKDLGMLNENNTIRSESITEWLQVRLGRLWAEIGEEILPRGFLEQRLQHFVKDWETFIEAEMLAILLRQIGIKNWPTSPEWRKRVREKGETWVIGSMLISFIIIIVWLLGGR